MAEREPDWQPAERSSGATGPVGRLSRIWPAAVAVAIACAALLGLYLVQWGGGLVVAGAGWSRLIGVGVVVLCLGLAVWQYRHRPQ